MKFYTIGLDGKVRSGKAETWGDARVHLKYGDRLYNPYTKRPVIGWRKYLAEMEQGQNAWYAKNSKTKKQTTTYTKPKPQSPVTVPKKPKVSFFPDDFEYDHLGYIKGHYTVDGFFEPD